MLRSRMCPIRQSLPVIALALLLAGGLPARTSEAGTRLVYELWHGGFQAFDLEFQLAEADEDYRLTFAARTRGLVGWLLPYEVRATTRGRRTASRPYPRRFDSQSDKGGRKRARWIDYLDDQPPQTGFQPEKKRDPSEVVPKQATRGTIDPVSGFYSVIEALARSGRCTGDVAIFDGRRLYRLRTEDLGADRVEASGYGLFAGSARLCRATVERRLGFDRKKPLLAFVPTEIDIWLAALPGLPQAVPVRLAGQNDLGRMVVHLVAVQADTELTDRPIGE